MVGSSGWLEARAGEVHPGSQEQRPEKYECEQRELQTACGGFLFSHDEKLFLR